MLMSGHHVHPNSDMHSLRQGLIPLHNAICVQQLVHPMLSHTPVCVMQIAGMSMGAVVHWQQLQALAVIITLQG